MYEISEKKPDDLGNSVWNYDDTTYILRVTVRTDEDTDTITQEATVRKKNVALEDGMEATKETELVFTNSLKEQKEALAAEKNEAYVQLLQNLTPADLLPGVKAFLLEAKEKNMPCAIASASKNAPFILEKLGVIDLFDAIVDPATLTKGKPDPEIFVKAAESIGIKPEEAIGFEDAQAGIAGIKACGMYAIGILAGEPLDQADRTVHTLDELNMDELIAL